MPTPSVIRPPASFEDGYFQTHMGVSLEKMLEPIERYAPAGKPARETSPYRRLQEFRRRDDPSLPMGPWPMELKRANWEKVSLIVTHMMTDTSKDLLMVSWMMEAEIARHGFACLAPCFALIQALCERWWEEVHPQGGADETYEARGNVMRSIDDKLVRPLYLVPLFEDGQQPISFSLWEYAHRLERMRSAKDARLQEEADTLDLAALAAIMEKQSVDTLRAQIALLERSLAALASMEASMRARCTHIPTMPRMRSFLERCQGPMREALAKRGVPVELPGGTVDEPVPQESETVPADAGTTEIEHAEGDTHAPLDLVAERTRAYTVLEEIADFLARIEPHSPVPYLLRRAVLWGGMDSAALYHEIFVKGGGRIDMLDVLGIAEAPAAE